MQQMSERVERGADTVEDAIEMFDEIANVVQEAESGIREISEATDDQAASSEEVVSMVDEVSSVSQQTAAEASNVSAATEEQTASLSEASENVQQLSGLAEDLHDQVSDFDTGSGSSAAIETTPGSAAAPDGGHHTSETEGRTPDRDGEV
jgi:methyl-accepting chemotaxis protein